MDANENKIKKQSFIYKYFYMTNQWIYICGNLIDTLNNKVVLDDLNISTTYWSEVIYTNKFKFKQKHDYYN